MKLSIPFVLLAVLLLGTVPVTADTIYPTVGFSPRWTDGGGVIVGNTTSGIGILMIKKITEDRVVLEFDLSTASTSTSPIYLNFLSRNIDEPNYSPISVYAFVGNGLVDFSDFYRTDNFITSFIDYGTGLPFPNEYNAISLDVTAIYNQFITDGNTFAGFLMLADTAAARYDLNAGYPGLSNAISLSDHPIPETSTLALLGFGIAGLIGYEWRRRKD